MGMMRACRAFSGKAYGLAHRFAAPGGFAARTRLDRGECGHRHRIWSGNGGPLANGGAVNRKEYRCFRRRNWSKR